MEQKLIELVKEYFANKEELIEINSLEVPNLPEKPKISTIAEFEIYSAEYKTYSNAVYQKTTRKDDLESRQKKIKSLIIDLLPGRNVWFKLDSINTVVGHETNDWPMDDGTLNIIHNPIINELPVLKHRHIKS